MESYKHFLEENPGAPKFYLGQKVYFNVKATAPGKTFSEYVNFTIVGIYMTSNNNDITYEYALSNDPPGPYHYGMVHYNKVRETDIFEEKPE